MQGSWWCMMKSNRSLREFCEDVILNRNNDNNEATEKLITFAETVKAKGKVEVKDEAGEIHRLKKD